MAISECWWCLPRFVENRCWRVIVDFGGVVGKLKVIAPHGGITLDVCQSRRLGGETKRFAGVF